VTNLRAAQLRAQIADIDAKIADNKKNIIEAESALSTETDGNTAAARRNRATLTGLVKEYQDYIASLAESGASQDRVACGNF
jgi:uncharacterized protein involved in exopolysaccharide biosynthesis